MLSKWIRSNLNPKHMVTIIAVVILAAAAMFLFTNQVSSLNSYSSFLKSRNYNYSVIIDKNLEKDAYAFYDRKISFSTYCSLSETINAVVLMESNNSHTTNDFLNGYDVSSLNSTEVAISSNIAKKNNLSVGSIIYSKNKVKNTVEMYSVSLILPNIYGVYDSEFSESKGLIVMGYNEDIITNIKTNYIFYYNEDYSLINLSGANVSGQLYSIETLKTNILKIHLLYTCIIVLSISILSVAYFLIISLFNINVYKKRRQYGNLSVYRQMEVDNLIYYFIMVIVVSVVYLIGMIWFQFCSEIIIEFLLIVSISCLLVYFLTKKNIRRS